MIASRNSAVRFRRTQAHLADGDDSIGIIVNLGASATVTQRGQDLALGAGDAVAVRHAEPAILGYGAGSHLGLSVPPAALAARVRDIDDAIMQLIPQGTDALQLLVSYLRLVAEDLVLAAAKLRRLAVTQVYDLVALALAPHGKVSEGCLSAAGAARLAAVLDDIAQRFQDPELCVAAVAQRQGISPRYLQRLLETSGISFAARVNELRLQRALALLREPGPRRICDLALDAGFSDISHFNRVFRARFGDTPSGVRAQGRRAA
jgi:AraC-like DNA-binding protein